MSVASASLSCLDLFVKLFARYVRLTNRRRIFEDISGKPFEGLARQATGFNLRLQNFTNTADLTSVSEIITRQDIFLLLYMEN